MIGIIVMKVFIVGIIDVFLGNVLIQQIVQMDSFVRVLDVYLIPNFQQLVSTVISTHHARKIINVIKENVFRYHVNIILIVLKDLYVILIQYVLG